MQAPKDPTKFTKMICVESVSLIDSVWGNCSLIEGESYDILLIDEKENLFVDWHLVKFGTGLCPHRSKYLKTESQIRDEKLNDILK